MKAYCLLFICLVGVWSVGEGRVARQLDSGCPQVCTMEYRPVCGSDGQTYGNPCTLKSAACMSNKVIQLVHDGAC